MIDRLQAGRPPLRVSEFAEMAGYSTPTIRKLLDTQALAGVSMPGTSERRIPVDEARRVLADLRVIPAA
jgi:hypothetical protein